MQETRTQILEILQKDGSATVHQLARRLDLSIGTLRHHVSILERDGLLSRERVRQPVGRPQLRFYLSSKGRAIFPKRYDSLSSSLISQIKVAFGSEQLLAMLNHMVQNILSKHDTTQRGATQEERAEFLVKVLRGEGFVANWELRDGEVRITQHTCPYHAVAQEHPEVCHLDTQLITRILDRPMKRTTCMAGGDHACCFEAETETIAG
jgi:predicted ArsR family transcriptional regulator